MFHHRPRLTEPIPSDAIAMDRSAQAQLSAPEFAGSRADIALLKAGGPMPLDLNRVRCRSFTSSQMRVRHVCSTPLTDMIDSYGLFRAGRVEDGRGNLGHAATPRFPSPLIEPDVPD
jgi:hypothetical protein